MYKSTIASAALMATAVLAQSPGRAIVVNGCNYDVHLSAVPAAFGGYDQVDKVLSPNDTFEQTFTQLSNSMGWSIKLSKTDYFQTGILQYEYTYTGDSKIWYDLSCVDGNPWDKNWEVTATGGNGCTPKQSFYRYATDDAYGMQDCQIDADITVLLCSGEDQNDEVASSASVSASSTAAAAAPSTYEAPSSTYVAPSSTYVAPSSSYVAPSSSEEAVSTSYAEHRHHNHHNNNHYVNEADVKPTTFAVVTTPAPAGVTVTEIATVIVTEIATATHYARHEHAHEYAARHPHARA